MGYRILDISREPSRLTETIGVSDKTIVFNKKMAAMLGLKKGDKAAFAVNDEGFLAFRIEGKNAPLGRTLRVSYGAFSFHCAKLTRHVAHGRYRVTGKDGDFWLTDIKYSEEV